jgi:uncharacterized repeat protein (TIGR02059 family)
LTSQKNYLLVTYFLSGKTDKRFIQTLTKRNSIMKKIAILIFFVINSTFLFSQIHLTIEGTVTNSSETGVWEGVNIQRDAPTSLIFRNNSITSVNNSGYLLEAGDEEPLATNNHLDGAIISGNKFKWNGTPGAAITHGLLVGYNINDVLRYNYLDKLPYGVVYKSGTDAGTNVTNTSGSFAYNIVRNSSIGIRIKGMNGVSVYNNTFYDDLSANNAFIWISSNDGRTIPSVSTGTKIKNNIFFATHSNIMIYVDSPGNLSGFECDYNVYYTTTGTMNFYDGTGWKSFSQWQALGYDTHSVVVNPNFTNTTDLVPASRLNYGTNLGTTLLSGLSTTAVWTIGTSPYAADQNGTWQVGARIYAGSFVAVNPVFVSSGVENATPSLIEITYDLGLNNLIIPSVTSFSVIVNSVTRTVSSVAISGTKVQLTLSSPITSSDVVTVSYTKPSTNPLQTALGGMATTTGILPVTNNVISTAPVYLSSVVANAAPLVLEMTYSISLANKIPASSSFSVLVNSTIRNVTSVVISGTKVQLTLASAIKYGDIVSVSYSKPASNPLQNSAGVLATSISAQSTINNLINPIKDTPITIVMTISPNHVHKIINIVLSYSSAPTTALSPEIIRITDLLGTLFIEKLLVTGATNIRIPQNLDSGIYNVTLSAGGAVMAVQRMRVY